MAKRFKRRSFITRRASPRRVTKVRRSRSGSKKNIGDNMLSLASAGYGGTRAFISNWISPLTARVPLGGIADEAVMYLGSRYLKGKVKSPHAKAYLQASMIVESARIGEAIADGSAFSFMAKEKSSGNLLKATIF